jgi:hypothetical protein
LVKVQLRLQAEGQRFDKISYLTRRDALRRILCLRPFANEVDERDVWKKVGAWLLFGVPCDDVFVTQQIIEENNDPQSR